MTYHLVVSLRVTRNSELAKHALCEFNCFASCDHVTYVHTVRRNGVQRVFIGTKGGLTRHMTLVDNPAEP